MKTNDYHYINLVLQGDTSAFSVLVDRYKDLVFALTLRMLKEREEAEEVAQDTFLKVYKSLHKFKGDSKLSTWIYKIAYNTCLDQIKKNKKFLRHVSIADTFTVQQLKDLNSGFERLVAKEREQAIKACIALLPGEDAFLLTLYYYEEQSLEDISKIIGKSTNTIKVKLFRSRKKLAVILKQRLEPEIIVPYEQ